MEDSEDNLSSEEIRYLDTPTLVRNKSKKRSLIERELETSLTARVTSPITNGECSSTSRYGRARWLKSEIDSSDSERSITKTMTSPKFEKSPIRIQSPVYKMHASNSPLRLETSRNSDSKLESQIENIYNENISLSRFGSDEKIISSPAKKNCKVYIRKDLIQSKEKEKEENIILIKNMFSPVKTTKPSSTHLGNILERSSEKYNLGVQQNGYIDTLSVVKTLDFDGNKKKKRENKDGKSLSKRDIFEIEAKCEYQVGDLAWARMGTYPFWPCIITRDPSSGTFVKKKLFGRIEHDVLHVTFLGDNGRRGWIVDNMLRKFLGRLEFETTRESYTSEEKKRDPRLYAAFFISEKKQNQWSISVDEAETLLREPKRLRIDILRDMLEKPQLVKIMPKLEKSKKVTRTNSDVSFSESLYDTLFSEDDSKNNESERRSRRKTRNKSLDVSEVVTACLDNMAAKTGIIKLQRQSHMDRWLQKAKSKTPEKSLFKVQAIKTEKDSKTSNLKPKQLKSKESFTKRSLSLRSQIKLLSHQNEHNYSKNDSECNGVDNKDIVNNLEHNEITNMEEISNNIKIEQLDSSIEGIKNDECNFNKNDHEIDTQLTVAKEELIVTENNHKDNTQDDQSIENVELVSKLNDTELSEEESNEEIKQKSNEIYDWSVTENDSVSNDTDSQQTAILNCGFEPKSVESLSNTEEYDRMDYENDGGADDDINSVISQNEFHQNNAANDSADDESENTEESDCDASCEEIDDLESNSCCTVTDSTSISNLTSTLTESTGVDKSLKNIEIDQMSAISADFSVTGVGTRKILKNIEIDQISAYSADCSVSDTRSGLISEIESNQNLNNILGDDETLDDDIGEEIESEDSTICDSYKNGMKNLDTDTNSIITETTSSNSNHESVVKNSSINAELRSIKFNIESSVNFSNSAITIEDNLSNCEMVCLPLVENKFDNNIKSSNCDIMDVDDGQNDDIVCIKREKNDDTEQKSNKVNELPVDLDDSQNKFNIGIKSDLIDNKEHEDTSDAVLSADLGDDLNAKESKVDRNVCDKTNGDDEYNKIDKVDTFLEDRSNRTSMASESIDSDNTEELSSSNDPQSDSYSSKANIDQKSIDNEVDAVSMNFETYSENSDKRRKHRQVDKQLKVIKTEFEDPEFLKYLELRQDTLIDENPDLTQEEITKYLYKTWLYEQSAKSDRQKTDDIEQATLVKGLNQEPAQIKKPRKRKVIKDTDYEEVPKFKSKEVYDTVVPKSKSKRKIMRPYYNEDYSDLDSDFESNEQLSNEIIQNGTVDNGNEMLSGDEYDIVEEYFAQLTGAKPNLFKGLIRERVCEICEKVGNLVKCKGCHATYHLECIKKENEVMEAQFPTRGRKKKLKNRGRKPKSSTDTDNQSDERSQDINASEDNLNISLDDIESEPRIVVDADLVEARLCATMKEMFDKDREYFSDSSEHELDWSDTEAGKCRIVDIPLTSKRSREKESVEDFRCNRCSRGEDPVCFVCKSPTSPRDKAEFRQRCQVAHCYRKYHLECLEHWPQTQFSSTDIKGKIKGYFEPVTCPRHVCHTCVSDDPRGCKTRFSGDKLARCVRCPATYHTFTKCLPAGSQILTGSLIICPRHYEHRPGKVPCHVNTGWCFICALGGSLICCEYCPTSFHAECLNIKPPEGGYMCEDCETGRLPLYGEMVWVKLGHYRWWPGIILHPSEIPANIMAVKHSPGEFVVRFFGQYDHYWVNRGRVFPFQEGDSGKVSGQKSKIDAAFTLAMEHAQRACEILKAVEPNDEESLDIASSLLPPHYVKLKVNKPVGSLVGRRPDAEASLTQCDCDPEDEDPCGPYSQCLNRMLLTECGPGCRAAERCNNRAFERRQYPRLVPYRTPQRGWGLKTLEHIRAGQFVIEYVGELIDEEEFRRRMVRMHEIRDENYYFLTLDKERMIDAGPKGNLARFMNHCCEPNCETQKWTVLGDIRVGLFALRDIPANSEVTFNYNLQCAGIEKKRCLCGAKRCSGYIGAKPKQSEPQPKKPRKDPNVKRTYKKRKNVELSPVGRGRPPKRRISRQKERELTEIEKDLLIIRNATGGMSSDEDSSSKEVPKRKKPRILFEDFMDGSQSPDAKRIKTHAEVD